MSADGVVFHSIFPVWAVLSVAVLLTAVFIWKEIKRKHRFLALRIVAQIILILSLTLLFLRPSVKTTKTVGSALLLTPGYDKGKADSLVELYGLRVIRTDDASAYRKAKVLASWHLLQDDAADIRFVLGEGIPAYVHDEFDLHFEYLQGEKPDGITRISTLSLKSNQFNVIQGEVNYASPPATLHLLGPAGIEDSISIKEKHTSFSLSTFTKQPGKFLYQARLLKDGKIVMNDPLPLEVMPERKLNVLFLQQYPSFETRYLKNYLGEKGHRVIMRYQVSKSSYRYEYANTEKQLLPRLNAALLNKQDLLIATPDVLKSLSPSEMQLINTASSEGLGIILLIYQPVKGMQGLLPYPLIPVQTDTVSLTSAQWKGRITLPATALLIAAAPSLQTIFSDNSNGLLSGYFYHGAGKTGFQLLNETYRLPLEGRAREYAQIWSPLIENTSRKQSEKFKVNIRSPFPYFQDQPVHFQIIAAAEAPIVHFDSMRIPLKEDVTVNQLWHGTIWPDHPGWHQLTLQDSSHFNFYVSGANEWNALNLTNQALQNKISSTYGETQNKEISDYQPVSPLLFFLLFVLASGALWLLAKL